MEDALRAKLIASTALMAVVQRVVWVERPAGSALPSITLTMVAPGRRYDHDGWDGLNAGWVQFDIWATSTYQCQQIAKLIIAEMESTSIAAGYELGPSFLDAEHNMDPEDVDGVGPIHRISMDWRIMNRPIEE